MHNFFKKLTQLYIYTFKIYIYIHTNLKKNVHNSEYLTYVIMTMWLSRPRFVRTLQQRCLLF